MRTLRERLDNRDLYKLDVYKNSVLRTQYLRVTLFTLVTKEPGNIGA